MSRNAATRTRTRSTNLLTPKDILAPHTSAIAGLAGRLRRIVKRAMPEAEERAYPVWKGIGYVHPWAGYVCGIFPLRDHVALAFEFGVFLHDPDQLLRAGRTSAKRVRYLEVTAAKDVRAQVIKAWLKQAVALRSIGGPQNNEKQLTRSARVRNRGPRS